MKHLWIVCALLCSILTACRQETREERFARDARELTEQCPIAIDTNTYLDSLVYDKENTTYQYCYSLHGFTDEQLTELVTYPTFVEQIKFNVQNSVEMKPYKDAGITFRYYYYSKETGALLGSIEVTPEEYNR